MHRKAYTICYRSAPTNAPEGQLGAADETVGAADETEQADFIEAQPAAADETEVPSEADETETEVEENNDGDMTQDVSSVLCMINEQVGAPLVTAKLKAIDEANAAKQAVVKATLDPLEQFSNSILAASVNAVVSTLPGK